jgi:D-alanyl-D-alanine carboxypeptidase/D-alanyl-D-alanine-endopeptidase (penicillin-binding protein 4)
VALSAVVWKAHDTASGAQKPPAVGQVPAGPQPVTPVLSTRRVPAPLVAHVRTAAFVQSFSTVTDAVKDKACVSVAVDGQVMVADNADTAFIPASNMKLLTASVALDVLGADYTFTTEVRGDVGAGGRVSRLVLVGGGDALLSTRSYVTSKINKYPPTNTTSLEALADAVAAKGVTSITNLVGDESRYDSVREPEGWGDAIGSYNASRLSALLVNDGFLNTKRARTDSTAMAALQVFRGLLADRGIEVSLLAEGKADPGPALASVRSAPLSFVIGEMLTTSDNMTAELMLKEIGYHVASMGSSAAGAQVVTAKLVSWGVPTTGFVMVDGSGLSMNDRVSCSTFVGVLAHEGPNGPVYNGLPIAGKTGTLAGFFKGTPAVGVLRAKTGSLTLARSLSGFYPAKDGSTIEFSFLVNGPGAKYRAESLWDNLVEAFDVYPHGPTLEQVKPQPASAG